MKLNIEIPDELMQPLIKKHLEEGDGVQEQINNAIKLYNYLHTIDQTKFTFGYGAKERFRIYNTAVDINLAREIKSYE